MKGRIRLSESPSVTQTVGGGEPRFKSRSLIKPVVLMVGAQWDYIAPWGRRHLKVCSSFKGSGRVFLFSLVAWLGSFLLFQAVAFVLTLGFLSHFPRIPPVGGSLTFIALSFNRHSSVKYVWSFASLVWKLVACRSLSWLWRS